jgi:hypothetical protein
MTQFRHRDILITEFRLVSLNGLSRSTLKRIDVPRRDDSQLATGKGMGRRLGQPDPKPCEMASTDFTIARDADVQGSELTENSLIVLIGLIALVVTRRACLP